MALGEIDYGLLGLIAGLASFVAYFNNLLAGSVARFYAYSIGEAQKNPLEGLEQCKKWFNTALLIHTVVPICLIIIGYPIGLYAIRNWLTIPLDRLDACIWLWRFVCISCFMSMFTVPWRSFYEAKQKIAELTLYSVLTTGANVVFLWYIVNHPGDWLISNGLWLCILECLPITLVGITAAFRFPECQFKKDYLWCWQRTKQIVNFAGWQMFGGLSSLLQGQGVAVLINKFFGPSMNAASSVANHIAGKTMMFSSGLLGALSPAITNACGAKDFNRMWKLVFVACKFGACLTLIFAIPIFVELPLIMKYWLKNPPQYAAGLCACVFASSVFDQISMGHVMVLHANGKIALYQFVIGSIRLMILPLSWLFFYLGTGVYSVGFVTIFVMAISSIGRALFAKHILGMSFQHWLSDIVLKIAVISGISIGIGFLPHFVLSPCIIRLFIACGIAELTFLFLLWKYGFALDEKEYILARINSMRMHFAR